MGILGRYPLLQADFGPLDPFKSSISQPSTGMPGPDLPAPGRFGPLLVLLVGSGAHSHQADFSLLDPLESRKTPFSKASLRPKSPFPGGCGRLLVLVVASGAHSNLAICGPGPPPAQEA